MPNLTGPLTAFGTDTDTRSATAKHPIGSIAYDAAGNKYRYVKAGAAIAATDAVKCNGSALGFDDVRKTAAAGDVCIGSATAAFALADFGFIQVEGIATVKVIVATAAGSPLVTTATAGTLGLAAATDLAGQKAAAALVTGVAAGSAVVFP